MAAEATPLDSALSTATDEVKELLRQLENARLNNPASVDDDDQVEDIERAVLNERLQDARSQLEMSTTGQAQGLPNDPELLYVWNKHKLKEALDGTQGMLQYYTAKDKGLKAKIRDLDENIRWEKSRKRDIAEAVAKRREAQTEKSEEEVVAELVAKERRVHAMFKVLKDKLHKFVELAFPPKSGYNLTVSDILSELVRNKTRGDLYVEITRDMWTPHVEFLLRCGIAKYKPDDHRYICLEEVD